jgi:formate dehydrogenase subunit delta
MALSDLVRMLNQIASNFSYEEPARAANDVASHLRSFWTPQMRADILEHAGGDSADLSEVSRLALSRLAALP